MKYCVLLLVIVWQSGNDLGILKLLKPNPLYVLWPYVSTGIMLRKKESHIQICDPSEVEITCFEENIISNVAISLVLCFDKSLNIPQYKIKPQSRC